MLGLLRSITHRPAWAAALLLAAVFIAFHVLLLAPSLEDIDSVNFALGVRDFDPALHRPHPPGYPIFVGLAKLAHLVLDEPRALAIWGALLGGLSIFPLLVLFGAIDAAREPGGERPKGERGPFGNTAFWASAIVVVNPLFWVNASRPMSDVPGLAVVLLAQALLVMALVVQSRARNAADPARALEATLASGRFILVGALVSGLALGFRSQAALLTLPLLLLVLVDRAGRGGAGALVGGTVWFAGGVAAWAVPLLVASGGPRVYLTALANQGMEDWTEANIIATHPSAQRVAWGLVDTLIRPWGSLILGAVVLLLACAGMLLLLARNRRGFAVVAATAVPYAAFHLLFQETPHTRYALPLVPPMAYLAVTGVAAIRRLPVGVTAGVAAASMLAVAIPGHLSYARDPSPSAQALAAINSRLERERPQPEPLLRVPQALGLAWRDEDVRLPRIPTLRSRQWLALVEHWKNGSEVPVWYVAEPEASGLDNRHDLAMIDPAARRLAGRYRWPLDPLNLLGGVRPSELDWYEMLPPGWMALEGWALTPRLAGLARVDGKGPARGGTSALLRRRPSPVHLLVGGRHLGSIDDPDVRFSLQIDGVEVTSWTVSARERFFLHEYEWNDARGAERAGPFALLTITSAAADGSPDLVETAIEQFDAQPAGGLMIGFDRGWHEHEYDPALGRLWHWTADSSDVRIRPAEDVVLTISGQSPLVYFDTPSVVRLRAGERILSEFRPTSDFSVDVMVPAAALEDSGGIVTVETDQTFVPDERDGNGDRRRLGLRIYDVRVSRGRNSSVSP